MFIFDNDFLQVVSVFCDNMGFFFFDIGIPVYMRKVHGLDTESVTTYFKLSTEIQIDTYNSLSNTFFSDWLPGCNTFCYSFSVCFYICTFCWLADNYRQAVYYTHKKICKSFLFVRDSTWFYWSLFCWLQQCSGRTCDCDDDNCKFCQHVWLYGKVD